MSICTQIIVINLPSVDTFEAYALIGVDIDPFEEKW